MISEAAPVVHDCGRLAERAARRGVVISLLLPGVLVLLVFMARQGGVGADESPAPPWQSVLFYAFLGLSMADLLAAFILRRSLFAPKRLRTALHDGALVERLVMSAATIVFALGASPMIYGIVLYLLGGDVQQVAVFAIVSLLAFRLLRPSAAFLEEVLEHARMQA